MIDIVTRENRETHKLSMSSMFHDRKKVFVDILKWDIPNDGILEVDQFDDDFAEYLIVCDQESNLHLGSVRLLRTDRPHILGNVFPQLCDASVPRGPSIREITRLCLSPSLRAKERREVRDRLATALVEYALLTDIHSYTGVAEMGWLTQILAMGWRCSPLGLPKPVGKSLIGALQIHIGSESINLLRQAGTYSTSGLQFGRHQLAA